ncbi:MAG: 2-hydroxyacyl-CoA dehydratase, partial [Sphingomonadales bacterium]
AFQRDWFKELRERVAAGAPLAVVNANSPQEILRAMDVPFVVNQWWASIVAAKQQSSRYFELLRAHGYPGNAEAYSSQGIAAALDDDPGLAPWGGLPRPSFLQASMGTNATPRIFEHWARETGAELFLFERSIESRLEVPIDWWDSMLDDWDELLEPARLDLLVAELRAAIAQIEASSDRRFDAGRFATIMDLVNEQEDYYRKTRDLIARAHPAPVSVADTMPATMVPQWHRGTEWARDAARDFYEEVKARYENGEAACPDERFRLMWVGRGMWSDMGFYQRWEESHGAVFVCSMYLSLAADGYIRRTRPDQDPLRALAARFVTMGDELRMPTWAGEWHVREAQNHGVHGAVALSDADPFVLRALRRAGVPVLALDLDNYNQEATDADAI